MNIFLAALNRMAPHFRVRGTTLWLAQGHPFSNVHIDLTQVAAHKIPAPGSLRLRTLRGRWADYSLAGFRPGEIARLRRLLTHWQRRNHAKHDPEA